MTTPDNCLDFDRFMAEYRGPNTDEGEVQEPALSIQVRGKSYPLPSELPATFMLAQLRKGRRGGGARTTEEYVALLDALLGAGTVDEWATAGLTLEEIVMAAIAAERLIDGEAPASLYERARAAGQAGEGEAGEATPKKPRRRRSRRR